MPMYDISNVPNEMFEDLSHDQQVAVEIEADRIFTASRSEDRAPQSREDWEADAEIGTCQRCGFYHDLRITDECHCGGEVQ